MERMYTTKFEEGEVALSETEQGKCWLYMYYSSGVRCYNKEGALINPFDEHPEYYTVDIRYDFHTIIYELSVAYQAVFFPEPSEKDVLRILQKGQALSWEEKRSNPDWCKVKYVYKRRPVPREKQGFYGYYEEVEEYIIPDGVNSYAEVVTVEEDVPFVTVEEDVPF